MKIHLNQTTKYLNSNPLVTFGNLKRIRPIGEIKISKTGKSHIPAIIRREIGGSDKIPFILNAHTVVLFRDDAKPEDILASLEIIRNDIMLRLERRKKEENEAKK